MEENKVLQFDAPVKNYVTLNMMKGLYTQEEVVKLLQSLNHKVKLSSNLKKEDINRQANGSS